MLREIDVPFSADCAKVAIAGASGDDVLQRMIGALDVWDLTTGTLLHRFLTGTGAQEPEVYHIESAAFSPDGQYVVGAQRPMYPPSMSMLMWDIDSGTVVQRFQNPDLETLAVRFSSDGRRLLTGAYAGPGRLWDVSTGALIRSFGPEGVGSPNVAFSPDDTKVLTVSNGAAQLWDVETGELLTTIGAGWINEIGPWPVAFSPDGRKVATSSIHGTVLLWSLVSEIRLNIAREGSGTLLLTWENPANGSAYALQQCPDLSAGEWTDVTIMTPGRCEVTNPVGKMFYRLKEP